MAKVHHWEQKGFKSIWNNSLNQKLYNIRCSNRSNVCQENALKFETFQRVKKIEQNMNKDLFKYFTCTSTRIGALSFGGVWADTPPDRHPTTQTPHQADSIPPRQTTPSPAPQPKCMLGYTPTREQNGTRLWKQYLPRYVISKIKLFRNTAWSMSRTVRWVQDVDLWSRDV